MGASISPHVNAKTFFFIELVLALVATAIRPKIKALTMHLAILPLTLVAGIARWVCKLATTMKDVAFEIALVHATIKSHLFAAGTFFAPLE